MIIGGNRMNMWKECEALQDGLVKMRRELHQIPEIGKMLPKTQQDVVKELEKLAHKEKQHNRIYGISR